MKKFVAMCLTAAMIIGIAPKNFVYAKDEKDTLLHIDFEGNVPENVTTEGNLYYDEGLVGQCGVFDGETYLTIPAETVEKLDDFTISAWVRFDEITPNVWQRIIDFGNENESKFYLGVWQWEGSNNMRCGLLGAQATSFGVFEIGEWINYTVVKNGEKLSLFINGRRAAQSEVTGNMSEYDITGCYVGNYNKNTEPTEKFHGAVDEFFIKNYAMSDEEVNKIAFDYLSDEEKVESLAERVYIKTDGEKFEYFEFDDGTAMVEWSSSDDEICLDGIKNFSKEAKDVVITARIAAGDCEKKFDYEYVVGEFDGEIKIKETTLEKMKIDEIRRNDAIEIDTFKTYLIKKKDEDKYLCAKDGALALTENGSDETAVWRFHAAPKDNRTYAIFNVKNGKCLNLKGFDTNKGAEVILYDGGKGINELWYVTKFDGKTGILSYYSEWFLNDDALLTGLDEMCDWEITECERSDLTYGKEYVEQSPYETMTDNAYYALKGNKGYLAADGEIVLSKNSYAKNANWLLTNVEDKYYTIVNRVTGENLNVAGDNKNVGASVILWDGDKGANEQWLFEKTEKGYLIFGKNNKNFLAYNGKLVMSDKPYYWTVFEKGMAEKTNEKTNDWINDYVTEYVPEIKEEITEGFVHPGIMIDAEDIRRMQKNVREGKDVWTKSFEKLVTNEYSQRDNLRIFAYDSNGDTTKIDNSGRLWNLRYDSRKATNQALLYVITGDERYRSNAMTIIRMWSDLRDVYRTVGSDRIDYGEISFRMAFAAELMKYSSTENEDLMWSEADEENFVQMLETIRYKHDATFYWMNQHSIGNMGTMANAIFRNDRELYNTAVKRTTVNNGSINTMTGSGGAIAEVFRIVDYDALNNDKIKPTFVHAEMGRDQGHAYGNVAALSICAMMTYRQNTKVDPITGVVSEENDGVNLFDFADDRLLMGADYMARYNLGYEVEHPTIDVGSLYCDVNDLNHGAIYTAFGILYNYYKYEKQCDMNEEKYKYVAMAHEYDFPEGNIRDFYLGYSDLLYAPNDAELKKTQRDGESTTVWQGENYTALNYGKAVKSGDFARIDADGNGTQIAMVNGNFAPGGKSKIVLKVRCDADVVFEAKNENDVYAPFAEGIIPNTNGEWKLIEFDILPERRIGTRVFYVNFKGDGNIDFDYMKFAE